MRKEKLTELKSLIEELKTIELKQIDSPNKFLKSETYECKINNGKTIIREKLIKGNKTGSAAIILPVTKKNEVVLIVEPRVFTKRTVGIGIPAGYIEKFENPVDAAIRELQEETGYTTEKIIHLCGFYQDMGCSEAFNECFLALNCEKTKEQKLDTDEYIRYFTCYYEEALELVNMNYIQGCNAIITLEKAKKYMKRR